MGISLYILSCSIIQIGIGYPFELLKTRSQMNPNYQIKKDLHLLYKTGGIYNFYKGCLIPFYTSIFINQIQFQSYLLCKEKWNDHGFFGGMIGGVITSLVINPFEIMKCHKQNQQQMIFRKHWYIKGLKWTILREIIGCTSYFCTYEYMYKWIHCSIISGGIAGITSLLLSYNIDVKKTQSQLNYLSTKTHIQNRKGLSLMMIRSFIVNGCTFFIIGGEAPLKPPYPPRTTEF
jgi:hypothetical protein